MAKSKTPRPALGSVLIRQMAEETTAHVLSETTRQAIEKLAVEFAREMMQDEEFRAQIKSEAQRAAHNFASMLKEP